MTNFIPCKLMCKPVNIDIFNFTNVAHLIEDISLQENYIELLED